MSSARRTILIRSPARGKAELVIGDGGDLAIYPLCNDELVALLHDIAKAIWWKESAEKLSIEIRTD